MKNSTRGQGNEEGNATRCGHFAQAKYGQKNARQRAGSGSIWRLLKGHRRELNEMPEQLKLMLYCVAALPGKEQPKKMDFENSEAFVLHQLQSIFIPMCNFERIPGFRVAHLKIFEICKNTALHANDVTFESPGASPREPSVVFSI